MSLSELRTDWELERFEDLILDASEQQVSIPSNPAARMRIPRPALVIVVSLLVLSVTVAATVILSRQVEFRGYTQVQHLLVAPFDHVPNDGGTAQVNFLNGTASAFNISVLNRWRGSIPYNLSFDLHVTYVAIISISGNLVQYDVNPQTGRLTDGATYPIAWKLIPDNHATGLTQTFVSVQMANDAGWQFFRADITMTFRTNSQYQDGTYTMTVAAMTP